VKGAFVGAVHPKKGLFDLADRGSIFFDEIGNVPLETQAKLLRVIQEREFMRLGGIETIKGDVRIIAATNLDLRQMMEEGRFREDLFYRLNVLPIQVPPLRERKEDIPALVRHFIRSHADEQGLKVKELTPEALEILKNYDWPGNIRELRNLIERLMIMVPGTTIEAPQAMAFLQSRSGPPPVPQPAGTVSAERYDSLRDARNAFEREYIGKKLREHNWNVSRTADDLQIERSHLHRKIKLLNIELRGEG
jgi:two-component system nitrogen regulation response regulator NtrX